MLYPTLNRAQIQRAASNGKILVNGSVMTKKQQFVEGDVIELLLDAERSLIPFAVDLPLEVIFEDDDIIVINKPAGMVTHPGSATGDDTLVHALLHQCNGKLSVLNGEDRPGIVHRLDKDTSGVLVAAKSDEALLQLIEGFKDRKIDKLYLAVCCRTPNTRSGSCEGSIGRHRIQRLRQAVVEDGKPARTDWEVKQDQHGICLMQCKIYTGRTHQVRVHMSDMGHPIVGDTLYGYRNNLHPKIKLSAKRSLLHAWKLSFDHPITNEPLSFEVDPPEDFRAWTDLMEK